MQYIQTTHIYLMCKGLLKELDSERERGRDQEREGESLLWNCHATQVGLKRDVTPQAAEPPPTTAHDEQVKTAEGEEPVAMRTNTSGDIEMGLAA